MCPHGSDIQSRTQGVARWNHPVQVREGRDQWSHFHVSLCSILCPSSSRLFPNHLQHVILTVQPKHGHQLTQTLLNLGVQGGNIPHPQPRVHQLVGDDTPSQQTRQTKHDLRQCGNCLKNCSECLTRASTGTMQCPASHHTRMAVTEHVVVAWWVSSVATVWKLKPPPMPRMMVGTDLVAVRWQ